MPNELTLDDLGPLEEWTEKLLSFYAEGMDDLEAATEMKISMRAFNHLYEMSEVFQEIVDFGRQSSQAWWHRMARKATHKQHGIDVAGLKTNLANRYNWTDKVEQKSEAKVIDATATELRRQLLEKLGRLRGEVIDAEFTELPAPKLLELIKDTFEDKDAKRDTESSTAD